MNAGRRGRSSLVKLAGRATWLLGVATLATLVLLLAAPFGSQALAGAACLVAAAVTALAIGTYRRRDLFGRLARAAQEEDFPRMLTLIDEICVRTPVARGQASLNLLRAFALAAEERYDEARGSIEQAPEAALEAGQRALRHDALAWILAHDGDGDGAVASADSALAGARAEAPAFVPWCLLTAGAARCIAGRPAEAVPLLEDALQRSHRPAFVTRGAFYLGEALRALGQRDEAAAAYARSQRAKHGNRFAMRAEQALAALTATPPYRG